jgi:TolB-like protein/tetratricopeptide (TPR) repeat protein
MLQPSSSGFWQRLRRRKLVQWTLLYIATAWGLLQGIGFVADAFGWHALVKPTATLIVASLLPVVLVLAWYHGDRGAQKVTPVELALLALTVLGGTAITVRYVVSARTTATDITSGVDSARLHGSQRPSIAVLHFDNRSGRPEDRHFVDGVHDDILTQLSKIGSMTVFAGSSIDALRGRGLSSTDLADALGATHLIEGGVQRAGDRIRVQVRLVDAREGTQVWAESFDRILSVENLFGIQGEIATTIAESLAAKLTPAERRRVNSRPTSSLAAWEVYQIGEQRMAQRTSGSLREAIDLFRRAIELDPRFAPAFAGLANATWLEADYSGKPMAPAQASASRYVEQALELDPDLPEALATKAKFMQEAGRLAEAEPLYRRAIELKPNDPNIHTWYAQLLDEQDRADEANASMERAFASDPLSIFTLAGNAYNLAGFGRFEEADRRFAYAQQIHPQSPLPYRGRGELQMYAYGRLDKAIPLLREAARLGDARNDNLAQALLDLGDRRTAREMLAEPNTETAAFAILPDAALLLNDRSAALQYAAAVLAADPRNPRALALLRDEDLRTRQYVDSLLRYAKAYPELALQDSPQVSSANYRVAVDLAIVLLATRETTRARALLTGTARVLKKGVRLGPWGYRIEDVRVLSVSGRNDDALDVLEQTVRQGWRSPNWRYYRDADPALAQIRAQPRFREAFARIERDIANQAASLSINSPAAAGP